MENIGKPGAGKPQAWFDEGALSKQILGTRSSRKRESVCKRARITAESVLYPTRLIHSYNLDNYACYMYGIDMTYCTYKKEGTICEQH